jgi:hypothetical protein
MGRSSISGGPHPDPPPRAGARSRGIVRMEQDQIPTEQGQEWNIWKGGGGRLDFDRAVGFDDATRWDCQKFADAKRWCARLDNVIAGAQLVPALGSGGLDPGQFLAGSLGKGAACRQSKNRAREQTA